MHQYKIEVFEYTKEGAVGALVTTRYADTPEAARLICSEYESQLQTEDITDEEGNVVSTINTALKRYQVRLHLLCYKLCTDKAAFFAQFQA